MLSVADVFPVTAIIEIVEMQRGAMGTETDSDCVLEGMDKDSLQVLAESDNPAAWIAEGLLENCDHESKK